MWIRTQYHTTNWAQTIKTPADIDWIWQTDDKQLFHLYDDLIVLYLIEAHQIDFTTILWVKFHSDETLQQ